MCHIWATPAQKRSAKTSVASATKPSAAIMVNRKRDDFEIALIRGALARDMPILGICRGIQEINVALGGTLHYRVHLLPEICASILGRYPQAHIVIAGEDIRFLAI